MQEQIDAVNAVFGATSTNVARLARQAKQLQADSLDADVAELLGIDHPLVPKRPQLPDVTSRTNLANLDERARELSERTGMGYERCVVVLQNRQVIGATIARMVEQLGTTVTEAFRALADCLQGALVQLQPTIDRLTTIVEDPPRPVKLCPRHGQELRHGNCARCSRDQQRWAERRGVRAPQPRRVKR